MVNQSTQKDPQRTDTDDPLAGDILQRCGPAAVEANHHARPFCIGDIYLVDLLEPINSD